MWQNTNDENKSNLLPDNTQNDLIPSDLKPRNKFVLLKKIEINILWLDLASHLIPSHTMILKDYDPVRLY